MNNSFARLIDGMCATLRGEVLTRLDDDFARGQVYGVINVLNTFKVRADWSAALLLGQIRVQQAALDRVAELLRGSSAASTLPPLPQGPLPASTPIAELLALRDERNDAIDALLHWLDAERERLAPGTGAKFEQHLRDAMHEEVASELRHAPRPLFAEMSSGRES